jgi:hypothetical protein
VEVFLPASTAGLLIVSVMISCVKESSGLLVLTTLRTEGSGSSDTLRYGPYIRRLVLEYSWSQVLEPCM